jgi:hypothetical protein
MEFITTATFVIQKSEIFVFLLFIGVCLYVLFRFWVLDKLGFLNFYCDFVL